MKSELKTTNEICADLDVRPTTFYKARKMAKLKAHDGEGTRYNPYRYDLNEARQAMVDYKLAVVERRKKTAGMPKFGRGQERVGDFSSGKGYKPVVIKNVEPKPEPEPEVDRAVFNPQTDGSMMAWLAERNTIAHEREGRKTAVSKME